MKQHQDVVRSRGRGLDAVMASSVNFIQPKVTWEGNLNDRLSRTAGIWGVPWLH